MFSFREIAEFSHVSQHEQKFPLRKQLSSDAVSRIDDFPDAERWSVVGGIYDDAILYSVEDGKPSRLQLILKFKHIMRAIP